VLLSSFDRTVRVWEIASGQQRDVLAACDLRNDAAVFRVKRVLVGGHARAHARAASAGKQNGRTIEIQRLIGRSLRAAVDMSKVGERTITLDCDVLQADGGTRTASITGAFCALYMAIKRIKDARMVQEIPVRQYLAAVSCGIVEGTPLLDLDYTEDFHASTDLNSVMTEDGRLVELQATAEGAPYSRAELDSMLALANKGIKELILGQKRAIATLG